MKSIKYTYHDRTEYRNENNQFHRIGGPAIEYWTGSNHWHLNAKRHRLSGPSTEYTDGRKFWYMDGEPLDYRSYNKLKKLNKLLQ